MAHEIAQVFGNFTLDPDKEVELLKLSVKIFNPISILLNLFVVLTYLMFKRKYPHVIALYFSSTAIMVSSFLLISHIFDFKVKSVSPVLCQIQGMGIQFFGAAVIWCWFFIALNLFMIVVCNLPKKRYWILHITFHVVTWPISLLQTVVPLFRYDNAGLWCWVSGVERGVWQFSTFYSQMCILTVIGWILWLTVIVKMCCVLRRAKDVPKYISGSTRYLLSVLSVSVVFVVMFTFRLLDSAFDFRWFPLTLAHAVALSVVGVPIFLVQGFTAPNLKLWWQFFIGCFKRCTKRKRPPPLNNPNPNSSVLTESLIDNRWSVETAD